MSKNNIPKKRLNDIEDNEEIFIIQLNNNEIQKCLDIIEETQPKLTKKQKQYLNNIDLNFNNPIDPILFDENHIVLLLKCINGLVKQNSILKRELNK